MGQYNLNFGVTVNFEDVGTKPTTAALKRLEGIVKKALQEAITGDNAYTDETGVCLEFVSIEAEFDHSFYDDVDGGH